MTSVRQLRQNLGLTQGSFSRLASVSPRAIAEYEAGKPISASVQRKFAEIDRLRAAIGEIMQPHMIGSWLEQPNDAFGGLKPLEVIERGETDRIWQMIFALRSGVSF